MKHSRLANLLAAVFNLPVEKTKKNIEIYQYRKKNWVHDWEGECEYFRRILRYTLKQRKYFVR